jgi:prepilin peptidase CpaA
VPPWVGARTGTGDRIDGNQALTAQADNCVAMDAPLTMIAAALGVSALVAAALFDLGWRLIPNALPVLLALGGLAMRAGDGTPGHALAVAAGAAVLLGLAWSAGLIGGGDAKLATAAALFVPPAGVAAFALATALAGGVLALAYIALRPLVPTRPVPAGRARGLAIRLAVAEARRIHRGSLPYAVAIAAGALVTAYAGGPPWA